MGIFLSLLLTSEEQMTLQLHQLSITHAQLLTNSELGEAGTQNST